MSDKKRSSKAISVEHVMCTFCDRLIHVDSVSCRNCKGLGRDTSEAQSRAAERAKYPLGTCCNFGRCEGEHCPCACHPGNPDRATGEAPTCQECGGSGIVEEDGAGALGYVVKRDCPRRCKPRAYGAARPPRTIEEWEMECEGLRAVLNEKSDRLYVLEMQAVEQRSEAARPSTHRCDTCGHMTLCPAESHICSCCNVRPVKTGLANDLCDTCLGGTPVSAEVSPEVRTFDACPACGTTDATVATFGDGSCFDAARKRRERGSSHERDAEAGSRGSNVEGDATPRGEPEVSSVRTEGGAGADLRGADLHRIGMPVVQAREADHVATPNASVAPETVVCATGVELKLTPVVGGRGYIQLFSGWKHLDAPGGAKQVGTQLRTEEMTRLRDWLNTRLEPESGLSSCVTLLDALVLAALKENSRAVEQALRGERDPHTGALWDTCFRHAFEKVLREAGQFTSLAPTKEPK